MARNLLIIEDDAQLRIVVRRFLKRKEWELHEAATGAEGIALAAKLKPEVILLDIKLPDMQGWEVCRRLRATDHLAKVPIVMMSGTRMAPADMAQGLETGADDYLSKPFDLSELLLRINAILKARGS